MLPQWIKFIQNDLVKRVTALEALPEQIKSLKETIDQSDEYWLAQTEERDTILEMFGADVMDQLYQLERKEDGLKQVMDSRQKKEAELQEQFMDLIAEKMSES